MRKSIYAFIMVLTMILTVTPSVYAQEPEQTIEQSTEIIYQDENYIVEETTTVVTTAPTARGTLYKRDVSKSHAIRNADKEVLAKFQLNATFLFDGNTCTCYTTNHETSTPSFLWRFNSASTSKSGNKAYGSYTAEQWLSGRIVSNTITLRCDKNGNIS